MDLIPYALFQTGYSYNSKSLPSIEPTILPPEETSAAATLTPARWNLLYSNPNPNLYVSLSCPLQKFFWPLKS